MLLIGLFIGIYAYFILFLGIFGYLYISIINLFTFFYLLIVMIFCFNKKIKFADYTINLRKQRILIIFLLLFLLQIFINLIGVLSPEFAFDALWYHLTLPKIYLLHHAIIHIPGGLLYYSDMPKLGELLYISALSIVNENLAKFLQFLAGIIICLVIYSITSRFTNKQAGLIAVVIFYSNIVVAWESTTAYIDLIRGIFTILALDSILHWYKNKKIIYFLLSAVYVGFSIMTKFLAIGDMVIYLFLIIYILRQQKAGVFEYFKKITIFIIIALCIPLPWFIFSLIHTGNPFYPFFTSIYPTSWSFNLINPFLFVHDIFTLFTQAADPVSPIYLTLIPLTLLFLHKFSKENRLIYLYSLLAIFVWYVSPRTGGGRFILPYLPALSITAATTIFYTKDKLQKFCLGLVIFIACITILYRGTASIKYIPYLQGIESKKTFLSKHLNFSFGDFYDVDGYFAKRIHSTDKVLLIGFHNLYYVDFPYVDATWIQKGEKFNYIATQKSNIPMRFSKWKEIYSNSQTNVHLYYNTGIWQNF